MRPSRRSSLTWVIEMRATARAMTLVEVLVATVILGIGVVGLMSAATLGMRNQQRGEYRAVALGLAQAKLAEVERIGPHVWMLARPTSGAESVGDGAYAWTLRIEQKAVGELFAVGVDVTWEQAAGGMVTLETWLNDYEAQAQTPREQRDRTGPGSANRPEARP